MEVVVASDVVAGEKDALDELTLGADAADLGEVRPDLVALVADLMAGDASALAGLIDGATGDGITLLGGGHGQRAETLLLGFIGRERGVERGLEDLVDFARQEAEGLAHEVLAEGAEHRRLAQGDGDLPAGIPGDTFVVLRQGERDEEFVLLERAGVRQQREVGVPLVRGELGVGEARGGVHPQSGIRRVDEEVGEQLERGVAEVVAAAGEREERLEAERRRFRRIGGDGIERGIEALVLHVGEGVEQQRRGALGKQRLKRSQPILGVHFAGLGSDGAQRGLTDGDLLVHEHLGDALRDARTTGEGARELT